MSDRFACEITFMKNNGTMPDIQPFHYTDGILVSTIPHLEDKGADIERDLFKPLVDDSRQLQSLENGTYLMFVAGDVSYESNLEAGVDNGDWVFQEKEVIVLDLFDLQPKKVIVKVPKR